MFSCLTRRKTYAELKQPVVRPHHNVVFEFPLHFPGICCLFNHQTSSAVPEAGEHCTAVRRRARRPLVLLRRHMNREQSLQLCFSTETLGQTLSTPEASLFRRQVANKMFVVDGTQYSGRVISIFWASFSSPRK